MIKVTNENYTNYLTFHGSSVETARHVVNRWMSTPEYYKNETIRLWVLASEQILKNAGV